MEDYFASLVVDDEALARGLAAGTLEIDTRLRDALRALASGEDGSLRFEHPSVPDDAAYAAEASVLEEIDGIVRAEARAEALETRLAELERGPSTRLRARARRLRRAAVD